MKYIQKIKIFIHIKEDVISKNKIFTKKYLKIFNENYIIIKINYYLKESYTSSS